MIVWTPTDPARFNGTTVVEWAEVSDFGQFELTVELGYLSPMLEEAGYAFAVVSAEEGGVCDRSADGVCTPTSLQGADPGRYASLDHPGDPYSFDIFSQALQAIKHPYGLAPLGEAHDRHRHRNRLPALDRQVVPRSAHRIPRFTVTRSASTARSTSTSPTAPTRTHGSPTASSSMPPHRWTNRPSTACRSCIISTNPPSAELPTENTTNHVTWEVVGASARRPMVGRPHRDPIERRTDTETRTDRRAGGT